MEALVTYTFFPMALTYVVVKSYFPRRLEDLPNRCTVKFVKNRFELIQDYLHLSTKLMM